MTLPKDRKLLRMAMTILLFWFLIPATLFSPPLGFAEEEFTFQENPPSNEEFVRGSMKLLWDKTFSDFRPASSKLIILKTEEAHPANWLLEDELISHLLALNYQVGLSSSENLTMVAKDSNSNLSESNTLFYRIIELKLDYPKVKRKGFLGTKFVTRRVTLNLAFRLEEKSTGKVLWNKREKEERSDLVKNSMIKSLNNDSYPFLSPSLPGDLQGKYLEPAMVTAVVGGLIYLFFANR